MSDANTIFFIIVMFIATLAGLTFLRITNQRIRALHLRIDWLQDEHGALANEVAHGDPWDEPNAKELAAALACVTGKVVHEEVAEAQAELSARVAVLEARVANGRKS